MFELDGLVFYVIISDVLWYEYCGMEFDVGWNFMLKSEILKMIEVMVMYKLNKFYFYFIDDEGWRFEIFGLLEFIEVCLIYFGCLKRR